MSGGVSGDRNSSTALFLTGETIMEKLRILVVDDDPLIRKLVEAFLTKGGYQVGLVTDGLKAQEALTREKGGYDLVITDHRMPHLLGVELVRWIKLTYPRPKVILMTGEGEGVTSVARAAGADGILKKPFTYDRLMQLIAECNPTSTP